MIKILAEWIGLPNDATEDQIAEGIRTLGERVKTLEGEKETLQKFLAERTEEAAQAKRKEKDLDAERARLFVEDAVRRQIIDKNEEGFWAEQYIASPEKVKKLFSERSYRSVLAKQVSLPGDAGPEDPETEASIRVAQMIANDTAKTLTEAKAYQRLWAEDPKLWERVSRVRREKAAAKGGEG